VARDTDQEGVFVRTEMNFRVSDLAISLIWCIIQNIHFAGLLDVQDILLADTDISRKTEDHSFGDHLISESVNVMPSGVREASIALCSMSL
jgi:hypothetical protein